MAPSGHEMSWCFFSHCDSVITKQDCHSLFLVGLKAFCVPQSASEGDNLSEVAQPALLIAVPEVRPQLL